MIRALEDKHASQFLQQHKFGYQLVASVGSGMSIQALLLAVQAALDIEDVPICTACIISVVHCSLRSLRQSSKTAMCVLRRSWYRMSTLCFFWHQGNDVEKKAARGLHDTTVDMETKSER